MKRNSIISLIAYFCFLAGASAQYNPEEWPKHILSLSKQGTLKDVFDSGIRPYRFPSLETRKLEAKHIRLTIDLASGKTLPEIDMEWINITPYQGGDLSTIEMATPQLTLDEARENMGEWLRFGSRAIDELVEYLAAVESDYLNFDDPYSGLPNGNSIRWKEENGPTCTVWFRKSFNESHPVRLYLKFSWSLYRPSKNRRTYDIPIPPPPGYEGVSMEAPKNFGPDSVVEVLRSQGIPVAGDHAPPGDPAKPGGLDVEGAAAKTPAREAERAVMTSAAPKSSQALSLLAMVCSAGIAIVLICVFRRAWDRNNQ